MMTKYEFLGKLRESLSGLPQKDIDERLSFYSEMIDDRIEEGLSEEEAVAAAGSVQEIVAQIVADIPLARLAKERVKNRGRLKCWEIILLVLGSPIWFSLCVAAVAVVISLYVSLWSVIISLWAVFGSLVGCSFAGVVAGIVLGCNGQPAPGMVILAGGIVCTGLAIFAIYGCKAATTGTLVLTKKLALWIKNRFIKKEEM